MDPCHNENEIFLSHKTESANLWSHFCKGEVLFIKVSFLYVYEQQHAIFQAVKCQSDLCTWQPPTFHSQSSKQFWWLTYLKVIFSTHCEQLDIHVLVQVPKQAPTVASFINRRTTVLFNHLLQLVHSKSCRENAQFNHFGCQPEVFD